MLVRSESSWQYPNSPQISLWYIPENFQGTRILTSHKPNFGTDWQHLSGWCPNSCWTFFVPWDLDSPSHVILWALRLAKNLESTEGFVGAVPRWSDSRSWYYHHRWKTTIIINNPHHHPTKSATKYPGYMLPVSQYHMEFNWKISNIFQLPFLDPLDDPCQKTAASSAYAWGIFRILWCAQGKSDTVASETTKKMDLELLRNSPFFVFEGSCFFPQNAFSEKLHFFLWTLRSLFFCIESKTFKSIACFREYFLHTCCGGWFFFGGRVATNKFLWWSDLPVVFALHFVSGPHYHMSTSVSKDMFLKLTPPRSKGLGEWVSFSMFGILFLFGVQPCCLKWKLSIPNHRRSDVFDKYGSWQLA